MTDAELVQAWRGGHEPALASLMERHRDSLYGYLRNWTGNREDAEDLFQETWVKMMKALPRYEERSHFKALLFRIASNLATDRARRVKRRGYQVEVTEEAACSSDSGTLTPLGMLEQEDRRRLLAHALSQLPLKHREVVQLRMDAGLSFQEIADLKGEKLGTVLPRMHRAVKKLKGYFKEKGYEIPS